MNNLENIKTKKSMLIAYILWFFLGSIGANYMYCGKWVIGIIKAVIFLIAILTYFIGIGFIVLGFIFIWNIIDIFITYKMVSNYNQKIELRNILQD